MASVKQIARMAIAEQFRDMADAIEATGESQNVDFIVAAFDELTESSGRAIAICDKADNAVANFLDSTRRGESVCIEIEANFNIASLQVERPSV